MPQLVSQKLFVCNDFIEHFHYEKPFWLGFPQIRRYKPKRFRKISLTARLRLDNMRRSKASIRRLVDCNPQLDKFVLLTFNTPVLDLKTANSIFQNFVKRLLRRFPSFQYLCVPEFQPVSHRVHYHLLCSLPWINKSELELLWGNGFVGVSFVRQRVRIGTYISKYITKSFQNTFYNSKRKYLYSFTLHKPLIFYGDDTATFDTYFQDKITLYQASFESDYLGLISYERAQLKKINIIGPPLGG